MNSSVLRDGTEFTMSHTTICGKSKSTVTYLLKISFPGGKKMVSHLQYIVLSTARFTLFVSLPKAGGKLLKYGFFKLVLMLFFPMQLSHCNAGLYMA